MSIRITSVLSKEYQEELETLLFMNPSQDRVNEPILRSIRQYGLPKVVRQGDTLRVEVGDGPDVQTLFALEESLLQRRVIGSVIYLRDQPTNLTILHIAVAPDYLGENQAQTMPLAVTLFTQVMDVARQIKDIKTVTVLYGKGKLRKIPL